MNFERLQNARAENKNPTERENVSNKLLIDDFISKNFVEKEGEVPRITLEQLRELKEKGITTEKFLDHFCQRQGCLLHGSVNEISNNRLVSKENRIFASNNPTIAILKSLHSNKGVNLNYPYFISDERPLVLRMRVSGGGKYAGVDKGYIYVVDREGFINDPTGSWQYIKKIESVEFKCIIETEKDDFKYPVNIMPDYKEEE